MKLTSEKKTKIIAEKLALSIRKKNITLCLNGDLGSGKTTFSRYLIYALQNKKQVDEIPSPTFTLLQTYEYDLGEIHHYDFYRLDQVQDLIELNFSESIQNNICIIEWANKFNEALPNNRIDMNFEITSESSREIKFHFLGNINKEDFLWI